MFRILKLLPWWLSSYLVLSDELEKAWNEAIFAYFNAFSQKMLKKLRQWHEKHMKVGRRAKNRIWITNKTVIFGEYFQLLLSATRCSTSCVTNFVTFELIGLVGRQTTILSNVRRIKFCEVLGKSVNKFGAFPLLLLLLVDFKNLSSNYLKKRNINAISILCITWILVLLTFSETLR